MADDKSDFRGIDTRIEEAPSSDHSTPQALLKLDKHGIPLVPQPSDHKDDPLNWPYWQKVYVACLVALLGFTVQLGAGLINPAFVQMAANLHVTVQQASYSTTVFILFGGVTPLFVVPWANIYGRRVLYIIFIVIAAIGSFVSAASPSYGGVIVGRATNGMGASIPLGIGAATICDMFTQNERGVFMGIYTVAVTNGPHVAPIAGGFIAQRLGWRWSFWIPAIIQSALWVVVIFTFPETLFSRLDHSKLEGRTYTQKMLFHGKILDRKVRARDFILTLRMTQYAAVTLPALWYCTANTYGSALFAVTGSAIGKKIYKFDVEQTGLWLGIPSTVGCFLGEMSAGWVSDVIINTYAKRHNGYHKPEARLYLLPGCILLATGTATYGYCIQHHKAWILSAVCLAISGFGTQIGTTMVYLYTTDSYKPQSGEIGVVINLFKSIFAFNVAFYGLDFSQRAGFDTAFAVFASINAVLLLPLVVLLFKGEQIRKRQGVPKAHQDL